MKTNSRFLLLFTFEWLVIFYALGNIKEVSTNYSGTKSNYTTIKYKDPTLCSTPASLSMFATIQPIANGLWNNTAIWPNGILPTANDVVVIPAGRVLTMVGTCRAKSIAVNGTLNAVNWQATGAWINLETESIMINSGGKLEIGTESQPYYANEKCVITLKGNKITNSPDSFKSIMVMGGGTLELHGKRRASWTNIATTANVGATQITVKQAVDWEIGDKIALTSTELAGGGIAKAWERVDEAEITGISGDKKTLTLKDPLKYKHIGGSKSYTRARDGKKWNVDIFAEVGLLTHYIKIQGEMGTANETDGFGGHMMSMKNSTVHVEQVELFKMGQKGIKGRYPFHWHLNEDTARGSYLKNSSVHKSFNRAVTIHGTDYVTVDGVFAYDHIGHGIFLEDGGERFNTIKNNVVFLTRRPKAGEQLTPSDNESNEPQNRTPASYWITNPNNYFENNVAAGTEGTGFWFAFPEKPMFSSGTLPYFSGLNPTNQPIGKFDGFVAHTCMSGWDVFDQLNPDHSLKKNYGWNITTRQLIQKGLFYGNDQAIYSGLGNSNNHNTVFYDCVFSDNKTATMLAGDLTIENSLFNSDSDFGVYTGVREFFRFYDGPGRHIDCHFEGWNRPNAEMIKQITGGGATENFNPTFRGSTKGFSEPFPFRFFPLPNTDDTRARKLGQFFKDYDGGLTGKAHTTLIRDIAFLRDGHEYRHPSWKNAARSDYYFASLWLASIDGTGTRISVVRSKSGTQNACFYEPGYPSSGTYKFPMIVNQNFMYTYHLDRAPSNKSILLIWNRGDMGDMGLACFKGLGKLGNFRVNGHQFTLPRLTSRSAVESATNSAYFIDTNGDVYLKFKSVSNNPHDRVNIFFNWDNNGSYTAASLPCTTNDLSPITTVNNTPPTVTFTSPTQTQYNPGTSLGVVVNALDSDGTVSNVNLYVNNVLVRQEGGAPYEWGTANPNANDTALLNLAAGTYTLKAVATDNAGATTEAIKQITVGTTNTPPTVTFTSPTQTQFDLGASLGVVVNALDSDGTVSNVNLYVNNVLVRQESGAPYEWGTANPTQNDVALLNLAAGTYTLKAVATDNVGATTETTKQITVKTSNVPPTLTFTSPTQTQFQVSDNLGVVVNATDSDGTISNVKLFINNVLVRQESAAPYEWGTAHPTLNIDPVLLNLASGTYVLKAVAIDNLGLSSTVSKTITVVSKTKIVQISKRNAPYAIDGNHNGADGQNVYLWSSNTSNINQQWIEIDRGNGYYSYQKMNTNYCIDGGSGGANDQNVYLWTCGDTNQNQQWKKIDMGSGYFRLEKRNAPSYSLDGGLGGANGQNLKLYTSSTNQSMQWTFTTVNAPTSNARLEDGIFSIYPNPAIDVFSFDLNENEINTKTIGKIYDASGLMVQSFQIEKSKPAISVKDLKPGIYLIYIEGKNKAYITKMIKQ